MLYFCTLNSCANVVLHHHQNPTRRSFVRVQALPLSSAQQSATIAQATGDLRTALVMSHRAPVSQSLPVQRKRRGQRERARRGRKEMENCHNVPSFYHCGVHAGAVSAVFQSFHVQCTVLCVCPRSIELH